jgi:hypothetical protein
MAIILASMHMEIHIACRWELGWPEPVRKELVLVAWLQVVYA